MTSEPTKLERASQNADLSRFASEGSDQCGRILIVRATRERHTCAIAEALALRLRSHGLTVETGDATTGMMPPPEDYDVVVLGLTMSLGRESELIATYIEQNRTGLCDVPSALFTVSTSGKIRDHDPGGFLERFMNSVAWMPDIAAAFAGGEPFPREGVMMRLATHMGYTRAGREGVTFRTDWAGVDRFADEIATELASATAEQSASHLVGRVL